MIGEAQPLADPQWMLMIGDLVIMSTSTLSQPDTTTAMSAMIAAIETDLARIAEGLAAARRASVSGSVDATRLTADLAALKAETGRIADGLGNMPLEMTPLALLSLDSEQLTLIKGVDARAARILNENGLHRFSDICALMPEDVKELSRQLGNERRISREGWIEQAALLAQGIDTAHAARVRSGDFACVVALPAEPHAGPTAEAAPAARSPAEPQASSATVIDLASKRESRNRKSIAGASRVGGMAIAAALVLALTLNAGNIAGMTFGTSKPACGASASKGGKCTIAQLP